MVFFDTCGTLQKVIMSALRDGHQQRRRERERERERERQTDRQTVREKGERETMGETEVK